ncbi:cation:proton antiporter [Candidatus Woesearchaeota archaeon]|nr:cation:proton antiporter [Candidatus Woesearchaeota archaeon]
MADALNILFQISIILLGGTLLSLLAPKIRVPEILLFILFGFGIQQFSQRVYGFFDLPFIFIATTGLLVLALQVFEGSASISFRTLDKSSTAALRLVTLNTVFHLLLFTLATWIIIRNPLPQAALFAAIFVGTSAPITLALLGNVKGYVFGLLRLESLLNTPFNALFPFLIIDIFFGRGVENAVEPVKTFLLQIFIGIGVGVLAGLILFKLIHHIYSKIYSPLAVLIASLLTYSLAEVLGGTGVLAVMALGLLFGNLYIKQRKQMLEVESVFSRSVYILLLVLFGTLLSFPLTLTFFLKVVILLIAYIVVRYLSIAASLPHLSQQEKIYMSLMGTNGVTSISIMVVLATLGITGIENIFELFGAFLLGQLAISSIAALLTQKIMPQKKTDLSNRKA